MRELLFWGRGGGGGDFWEFLVEVYCLALQILTLFQTKKCHFSHPFSDLASYIHTRFQTSLRNSWGQLVASLLRKKDFLKSTSNSHISLLFLFICNWNEKNLTVKPPLFQNLFSLKIWNRFLFSKIYEKLLHKICQLNHQILSAILNFFSLDTKSLFKTYIA